MSTFDLNFENDFYVNNQIDNIDSLKSIVSKFHNSDIKNLIKIGILNKDDAKFELLSLLFEDINTPLFRSNNENDNFINSLWLSKSSKKAKIVRATNSHLKFDASLMTNKFINEIAKLSVNVENVYKLHEILMSYGIILIYERYIQGSKIDGACFKLNDGTPVISISFRFDRLDSFWFTLLHEISHIILHYDNLNNPIIDDLYSQVKSTDIKIERQANNLAKSAILDRAAGRSLISEIRNVGNNSKGAYELISDYSKEFKIHPALVAGVLSFDLNNYTLFAKILNEYKIRDNLLDL